MSLEARFEGRCADCGERIHIGDLIEYDSEPSAATRLVHVDCDPVETDIDRDAKREVCDKCWLLKPCGCEVVS